MGLALIGQTNKKIRTGKLPRTLRQTMTDAERTLWRALSSRQISGVKFRRQHPFGDYILDFVSLDAGLVIEVDGSQHGSQIEHDRLRTEDLEKAGFQVLRFWNHEVLQNIQTVKENIWMTIQEKQKETHPHPNPPLEGEGACPGRKTKE
jgi:very-short-patch-repair endonuclease